MTDQPPNLTSCIKLNAPPTEEVIRLDKEGFHYKGQFIADAGEAQRLMVQFLKQQTHIEPVPVSERPWDRNGWCDENGWCWGFDADDSDSYWLFDDPASCPCWTHLLPHHALPVPQQEVLPND